MANEDRARAMLREYEQRTGGMPYDALMLLALVARELDALRERAAQVADGYADPDVRRDNLRLAAEIGTDAGAGDALGSSRTARSIAAAIRALD